MCRHIPFTKLTAAGNDFVCIDNCEGQFDALLDVPREIAHFAHTLCRHHVGIGADGVIFCQHPEIEDLADIGARIFEWDGSEVELCGNGTACFVTWATHMDLVSGEARILTPSGVVRGERIEDGYTRVCISLPEGMQTDLQVPVDGEMIPCDFVITGIPHAVTLVDDIDTADVAGLGPALRHHEMFKPRGVNADFVQVLGEGEIALRTWEFGVEGETLACGTGSAASAVLAARRFGWTESLAGCREPVLVRTLGGKTLRVLFSVDGDGEINDLCLETPVSIVYSGDIAAELLREALP